MADAPTLSEVKRDLDAATLALHQPGAGAPANLECRLADVQQRFLTTPATSLADVVLRLEVMADIVRGLGEPGYLLHLIEATREDVGALSRRYPQF
jgi:hypothetical protein